jgi:hypothetical protein
MAVDGRTEGRGSIVDVEFAHGDFFVFARMEGHGDYDR